MSSTINLGLAGLALAVGLSLLPGAPAEARIRCHDEYQVTSQGEIVTPYCEESYLASVAREYGMSVTAEEIRSSFSLEKNVCRFVGHDSRVMQICSGMIPSHRRDCLGVNCLF